jgi:DNA-binding LytR/AlgR family response regulator
MIKLNCLVVDDEPIAQQILENYILQIEALQLVGKCNNAFEALNTLHRERIDVLFLDIKMPSLSGLDMLKSLQNPPKVILTTAFSEFGVESYEYNITDYLLKPIPFERFLKAINKILIPQNLAFPHEKTIEKTTYGDEFIFFKSDKKIYKFYFKEILFFEGSGNYVKVHTEKIQPLMILEKLSDLEEKLPKNQFLRVHKSFIINLTQIRQLEGNMIKLSNKEIPVSGSYRQSLEIFIQSKK